MILTIVAILFIVWLICFAVFHVGALIHILIAVAIIALIWDFVARGRRT